MQLGESSLSYGYESTGKVCASSSFFDYGTVFGEGDVIGTYLDLESEPKQLRYTKNGEDLGVAMSLTVNLDEKPLFPHILVRNMIVELNFGGNENPWFEILEGYSLIQNASEEHTTEKTLKPMAEDEQCEVCFFVKSESSAIRETKFVLDMVYIYLNTMMLYACQGQMSQRASFDSV